MLRILHTVKTIYSKQTFPFLKELAIEIVNHIHKSSDIKISFVCPFGIFKFFLPGQISIRVKSFRKIKFIPLSLRRKMFKAIYIWTNDRQQLYLIQWFKYTVIFHIIFSLIYLINLTYLYKWLLIWVLL